MPRFFYFPKNNLHKTFQARTSQISQLELPKIIGHDGMVLKRSIAPLKKPVVLTLNKTLMQLVGGATNFNRAIIEESALEKIPEEVLQHYYIAYNPPEEMLCLHRRLNVPSLASFLVAIEKGDASFFNGLIEVPYYYFFRTNKDGLTALEVACQQNNLLFVRLILDVCKQYPPACGLDNISNIWKLAIKSGNKEIIAELLRQSGHCPSLANVSPRFLLNIAECTNQEEITCLLQLHFEDNNIDEEHQALVTKLV